MVVRLLLDKGAPVNETTQAGHTAQFYAIVNSQAPVLRLLLERGADPAIATHAGWTCLITAASAGNVEVVHMLLSNPVAKDIINCRERDGQTALWRACNRSDMPRLCGRCSRAGRTPLSLRMTAPPQWLWPSRIRTPICPPRSARSVWRPWK
jgi:ankyrin repeat protein